MNSTPNVARVIVFCLLELLYFVFSELMYFLGIELCGKDDRKWLYMLIIRLITNAFIVFKLLCYVPGANIVLFLVCRNFLSPTTELLWKGKESSISFASDCLQRHPEGLEPEDVEVNYLFSFSLSLSLSLSRVTEKVAIIFRRKERRQIRLCICTVLARNLRSNSLT